MHDYLGDIPGYAWGDTSEIILRNMYLVSSYSMHSYNCLIRLRFLRIRTVFEVLDFNCFTGYTYFR